MKSLACLFRFGPGPSSSHTIGPYLAAKSFREHLCPPNADAVRVVFYGSLALTGTGHGSEKAVKKALNPLSVDVVFDVDTHLPHPLTMDFYALKKGEIIKKTRYLSLGGGAIYSEDDPNTRNEDIYPFSNFQEIREYMTKHHLSSLREFCLRFEKGDIDGYLMNVLKQMIASVDRGLAAKGLIPANQNPRLRWERCAGDIHERALAMAKGDGRKEVLLSSYAYAVAEGSACGEEIVTAPTCGSSGVLPACLYYLHKEKRVPLYRLRDALYAAGIFGDLVKQNASIAGSIGGCQAEIGTASSMAAAAVCDCMGLSLYQIEYAAECAMEHFLGLSCDPVDGYVIIPCIERNGVGALRAYDSFLYAKFISPVRQNQVSFDNVVKAMKMTGDSLSDEYKETSLGGLAHILKSK